MSLWLGIDVIVGGLIGGGFTCVIVSAISKQIEDAVIPVLVSLPGGTTTDTMNGFNLLNMFIANLWVVGLIMVLLGLLILLTKRY